MHLDRIRYPGGLWRDPGFSERSSQVVTRLVRTVRESMPDGMELTCSLAPDYLAIDDGGDPEHLVEYGQDGWRWVREGWSTASCRWSTRRCSLALPTTGAGW